MSASTLPSEEIQKTNFKIDFHKWEKFPMQYPKFTMTIIAKKAEGKEYIVHDSVKNLKNYLISIFPSTVLSFDRTTKTEAIENNKIIPFRSIFSIHKWLSIHKKKSLF